VLRGERAYYYVMPEDTPADSAPAVFGQWLDTQIAG
jgi:hypothetical protein